MARFVRRLPYTVFFTLSFLVVGVVTPHLARAQLRTHFKARATVQLCPEFPLGGVSATVQYRIGDDPTLRDTTVLSQEIDESTNVGTFEFLLPANYGTTDLHVVTTCVRNTLVSQLSNDLTLSNCDAIALYDTDQDGIANNLEDTNCDNFFSPGDLSNPDNLDTDGDGVRDIIEVLSGTNPTSAGSSPRPMILAGRTL